MQGGMSLSMSSLQDIFQQGYTFQCQQNLDEHKGFGHGSNVFFNCNMCSKMFFKRKLMKSHIIIFQLTMLI